MPCQSRRKLNFFQYREESSNFCNSIVSVLLRNEVWHSTILNFKTSQD
uniref:Uncharacterized protein n=1 Tax=Rhizophora mucronata TaxID=61149 RepID=A0A2P2PU82_RHIMU